MSGTTETTRVAGIPSGYPSEIDASVKIRWVAPMLINMSEREVDLLKYVGGPEQFSFNNTTIEWVEDDPWNRRLNTHGGLTNAADTSLAGVTNAAHRYPVGTVLYHVSDGEYVRVTAHADASTLTISRDITGGVAEGAWATTDEVIVAAFSMDENDDYVFRPTSIFSLPYNRPQIHQAGVQATFRRQETALYGLRGSDLDTQAANLVAEQFVAMNQTVVLGQRFDGTASVPSMAGGCIYYVTTANGAQVSALSSAALTRKDIDDKLQALYYSVGGSKMAKTLLISAWGKRKVSSFFSAAERLGPGAQAAGVVVDRIHTDFGDLDVMMETSIPKNDSYFVRKENIQVGHHGNLGRPQMRLLPPSTVGPRTQKVFYADISLIVAGVESMGRLSGFSTTT